MKVLFDSCVWGGAVTHPALSGHDVDWVGNWAGDPGDLAILARAHAEERVLVTLDKDFGALAIVKGAAHAGIIRLVGIRAREQGEVAAHTLNLYADLLSRGAILTVEADRVRIRSPKD